MSIKKQIDTAIKELDRNKDDLFLKWVDKSQLLGNFKVKNAALNKEASGRVKVINKQLIARIIYSNYSRNYIRKKLRLALEKSGIDKNAIQVKLNTPKIGSIVTTQQFINELTQGDIVDLEKDTYYFSVDSDLIDCNGSVFREKFQAAFIEQIKSRCDDPSSQASLYTKFKLQKTFTT